MKIKRFITYLIGIIVALGLSAGIYVFAYSYTYSQPVFTTSTRTGVIGQLLSDITKQPLVTDEIVTTTKEPTAEATTESTAESTTESTAESTVEASIEPTMESQGITLEVLSKYNGVNGEPAYVAFKGVVYDVSALADWSSGTHHGIKAGTDITDLFSTSPHAESIFKLAVVVDNLATS